MMYTYGLSRAFFADIEAFIREEQPYRDARSRALWPERKPAALLPCGTHAAYSRHVRAGTAPCVLCREANREYMAAHRSANTVRAREQRDSKSTHTPPMPRVAG